MACPVYRPRPVRTSLARRIAAVHGADVWSYSNEILPSSNFLALGLGKQLSLLASGIESSLKVGCTIIESLIIDRVGRKGTLILGSAIMAIALLVSLLDFITMKTQICGNTIPH